MRDSFQDGVIRQWVRGLSFIDVGGLWGTVNEKVTVASKAGASSVAMADITPAGFPLWRAFEERARSLAVLDYASFPGQNLDDADAHLKLGVYDFVHCSGIVYHTPSPLYTLARLRSLTRKYLLVGSMVMPERIDTPTGALDLSGGQMIFLPSMNESVRRIMADYCNSSGLNLTNVNARSELYRIDGQTNYSPWWWFFSAECFVQMIAVSGFEVLQQGSDWDGRVSYVFCMRND